MERKRYRNVKSDLTLRGHPIGPEVFINLWNIDVSALLVAPLATPLSSNYAIPNLDRHYVTKMERKLIFTYNQTFGIVFCEQVDSHVDYILFL